ncbi:hypothetical protein A1O3_01470 [Capronia epimyces CBS 606.96]|uniref:NAD(P)-binding protein n=1 Tax=Capronia epimyces CBS 606.96 TaxID=1182542 RepID=W9ZEK2_9EURO|nr:uncharacterized protein A1O3_01470 [Capronia epimyces CBS 606.96]EXJ92914.1 hypothetical protein A1O3_01470 [Capronia epimyces CBS 606.96]
MTSQHVVLVTGASGDIGRETVRILLEELGASVVATDIVLGAALDGHQKKYPGRLEVVIGDIVDPTISEKSVALAVQKFGKLTGVCLNAGVFGPGYPIDDAPVDKWEQAFRINVLSHLHTLKYALPELRKTKGRITSTTSAAGAEALFKRWGFYGVSKAAVGFLVKQVALEERENGVTAIGISPGLCDTQMVAGLLKGNQDGWGEKEAAKYHDFVSKIELTSPTVAGNAYAQAVTKADPGLSGLLVEYDDPRLPIAEHLKRKSAAVDYTKASAEAGK